MCDGKCKCKEKRAEEERKDLLVLTSSMAAIAHSDCPVCQAIDAYTIWDDEHPEGDEDGEAFQMDGFLLDAKSECLVCGARWTDTYKFMGKRKVTYRVPDDSGGDNGSTKSIPEN